MNIAIQTFKMPNDLAPTYLLELIEKQCRIAILEILKNPENFSHEDGATWNKFLLLFGPQNLKIFARGIENDQRPQNFQRWPASLFVYLIESIIR